MQTVAHAQSVICSAWRRQLSRYSQCLEADEARYGTLPRVLGLQPTYIIQVIASTGNYSQKYNYNNNTAAYLYARIRITKGNNSKAIKRNKPPTRAHRCRSVRTYMYVQLTCSHNPRSSVVVCLFSSIEATLEAHFSSFPGCLPHVVSGPEPCASKSAGFVRLPSTQATASASCAMIARSATPP